MTLPKNDLQTRIQQLITILDSPSLAAAAITELVCQKFHNPDIAVAQPWHVEDILEQRPDLSEEQAVQVLREAHRFHDADVGLNWEVLVNRAEELFPEYPD